MILLHISFRKRFFIWGERSFRQIDLDCALSSHHPFAANHDDLVGALAAAGFEAHADGSSAVEVDLPAVGPTPLPGSSLLGSVRGEGAPTIASFVVPVVPITVADMLELSQLVPGDARITSRGALISHGVMASLDLCFAAEAARFAASLLERGRFLPDVCKIASKDGEDHYESLWRPLLIGEDAETASSLDASMPPILRLASRAGDAALAEMLEAVIDGEIRSAWSGRRSSASRTKKTEQNAPSRDSILAERKKRGRLVSALNPHALWARSLGWLGDAEGLSVSLESIYADVREWWNRFAWFAKAPFKLRVSMSSSPDDQGAWSLDYSIIRLSTGESVDARDVWSAGGSDGDYMRRYMLLLLGRIGSIVPAVMPSLDSSSPTGCLLTRAEASDFLSFQAASIEAFGVSVVYPDWWRPSSADRVTLRGRLLSGKVDPTVFAYTVWSRPNMREDELTLEWELALDGELLAPGEARALSAEDGQLVRVRGGWTFVHRAHFAAVTKHAEMLPKKVTAGEAIRIAIRDPFIDGFSDAPDLEVVYETLKRGKPRVSLGAPSGMVGELRPYQLKGYSWMAFLTSLGFGVCLADDMGLGKTVQTLALIKHHRDMGDLRPVLLVCPTSVLENWRLEIARFFPDMTMYTHYGRGRLRDERFSRAAAGAMVVLTSYSLLVRDAAILQKIDWVGVVLDEAQNIKNPETHQARAARSMKSEWRAVLTGTPIENHVGDLWSIMEFLMPGMLGTRKGFRSEYVKPIQESRDRALMDALRRQVGPLIMRRMKTDRDIAPELPDKIESKVYCALKREQAQLYGAITEKLEEELAASEGIKRKGVVLTAITRIKQVCDHPSLYTGDDDSSPERSSKMERLMSLADEMYSTHGKALIFTQYVGMGEKLKTQLQERFGQEVFFLHGGVRREVRDEMVRRFQESRGSQFFVLSLRAGGVGLNLTGANHVIMYDRWWNPAVENQAIDRAYRIGQSRKVQVHIFCCNGTIEERIDAMLESKKSIASEIIDIDGENWVTELSDREIKKLLTLSPGAVE